MDLFEYQARDLFEKHNVPVLKAQVASTSEEARNIAQQIGGTVVIKAQVKVGGRGKAGGVKLADTPDSSYKIAQEILGMNIKDHIVEKVMVTSGAKIAEEYYFSILLDRTNRQFLAMCSTSGGVEIEQLAVDNPEALVKMPIKYPEGITRKLATDIVHAAGFEEKVQEQVIDTILKLWQVFVKEDALLVEVNPLVKTVEGEILALDGKVSLDENSAPRNPDHKIFVDNTNISALEQEAKASGLNYVKLDGQVGIIGNGAGLVMSTLDVVAYAGKKHNGVLPANFLDIGGGASAEVMAKGLSIVLADPQVKSVFVNIFGGITACDAVANGILGALESLGKDSLKPIIVRLDGNSVVEGRKILSARKHPSITLVETMDEAADRAADLANTLS